MVRQDISPDRAQLLQRLLQKRGLGSARPAIAPEHGTAGQIPVIPRDRPLPLSFAQERLWFIDQLEPGSPAYYLAEGLRLAGPLDVPLLVRSLQEIVRRHETLRTTFETVDGRAIQVVHPTGPARLPVIDLHGVPRDRREEELRRLAREEAVHPFVLSRGPLLRTTLVRVAAEEHVALLTMHHIISDAWSMGILIRELATLYNAFRRSRPSPLPELPVQYADFAAWQREWLSGQTLEGELSYWRERLAGAPALLELPTDRPRPAVRSYHAANEMLALSGELSEALLGLGRSEGTTPFMTLLAIFQLLLARHTGQEDISVGAPIAGRHRHETEGLVGFFVNNLVLRGDLAGDPSTRGLLARTRDVVLAAYSHQDLPFEMLVQALRPERTLSHDPLFQVALNLDNTAEETSTLADLKLSRYRGEEGGAAHFDLVLKVRTAGTRLAGSLEYRTDLFDAPTIRRMAGHLRNLLAAAGSDPSRPVGELRMLSPAEAQALLWDWNELGRVHLAGACLHDLVAAQAARIPGAVAIVHARESLSYGELDGRANSLALRLRALGIGPESRVGIFLERTPEMVVALLGVLKAGGAYVPMDPAYPRERLDFLLADSGAGVLLTRSDLTARLPERDGCARVCLDEIALVEASAPPPGGATPGNLAYVIYTSGSTGRPKGVGIEHRSAAALLDWSRGIYSDEEMDGVLAATSICFDLSVFELFVPLSRGGRVVLADNALGLPALAGAGVRLLNTVPSAASELLRLDGLPGSVRTVNLAGEPLRRNLAEQLHLQPGIDRVLNLYGPSEDTTYSTWSEVPRSLSGEPTIGRPIAGTQAYVLDTWIRPVPIGAPGELCLGGAGLARGYLGRPDLTAERFVPDPFAREPGVRLYRTGDRVRRRPDGEMEFQGRLDHQVKVRGFRVELGEVEAALLTYPAIREAVVLPRGEGPDRRLVAFVVPVDGAQPAAGEIRDFLRERLPEPILPSTFELLDALPLTSNGKVDRAVLSGMAPQGPREPSGDLRGPVEEIVAGVWAEVLGVNGIGARSNFFELGGHSLLATQVVSRLRYLLAVDLPVRAMFETPTLAELAGRVQNEMRAGDAVPKPALGPVPRNGPLPLSFAQLRLWFLHRLEPDSAAYNMPVEVRLVHLHAAAMEASLSEMARRHESLRTVFRLTPEGEPAQVILAEAPIRLPLIDLSGLPEGARRAEAGCRAREEARRPFDLEAGPLLRVSALRLAATEHSLLATLHHAISDGWSLRVFAAEMTAIYEAYLAGRPSPLAEPGLQYADFAVWQRRWLQGEVLETQLAYWMRQLRDLPPPLALPAARVSPGTSRSRGAEQRCRLSAEETADLRTLSRIEGSTPFMILLAGLQALLCRYTGQIDFCTGTPIAGRNQVETEGLIGCFLNTLALRANLAGDPSFRGLLARVRETSLGAYAHQDLPFEKLLEELQPERDLQRTPVFQVLFNMLNLTSGKAARARDVAAADEGTGDGTFAAGVKLDLAVYAEELGNEIEIRLEYDSELFDEPQMAVMAGHLRELLVGALTEPDRRISDLVLSSPQTRRRVRSTPRWTWEIGAGVESSLGERFRNVARAHAGNLAISTASHLWTYEHLDQLSDRVALSLARLGDSPRIALLFAQGAPRIMAVLAALKAGKTYVPLDPDYPEARLVTILKDAEVGGILTDEGHAGLAQRLGGTVLRIDLAEESDPGMVPAAELPPVAPETPAYILYTSGSSGDPKGVVQSHRNVLQQIRTYSEALGIMPTDRLSLLSSYAFDAAVMDLFGALLNGATLLPFDVRQQGTGTLGRWMREQQVTIFHSTPTLYRRFLDELEGEIFPSARLVVLGGEKCVRRDLERFRAHFPQECRFVNGLGPTESTLALQFFAGSGTAVDRETVPVGHPVAGTAVLLRNAAGEQAAIYGIGEIEIRSPWLALGYWRRPDLTAAAFLDDPEGGERRIYRTGDLGRWLPDGSLEFVGRRDSQVKVRGHRVELGEIEAVLNALPGVREAVVVAHEDPRTGEPRLAAYLLAPGGEVADPRWLHRALRQRLPDFMIPADFVAVEAWPLTSTGKVDRNALPESPQVTFTPEAGGGEPRTPLEELLCTLWAEVLGLEKVGVDDDFFALGGHSLLATQLLSRIRRLTSAELPLRAVFEAPTAAMMAERLERLLFSVESGPRPPVVPLPRNGALPLSFAQQRFWFLEQLQPGTAAYNLPAAVRLSGPLEVPALAAALTEVARRHEVLRSIFVVVDGVPCQRIAAAGPVPLPVLDLSSLPPGPRRAAARELAREEARHPFDLERESLFRAGVLRLGDREHALLVSFHHAVTDGWSQGIFWRELAVLYDAAARHLPSPLADLPLQYADFAAWQRGWLTGEVLESQLAYWRERLRDLPPSLDLPVDRPRPALSTMRGGVRPLELPVPLSDRVRDLGRRTGTTPFMILLAALQAVLARHAEAEDLCVGTPIAGRTRVELEGLIGVFVNTLVMRGDLTGDPSFLELLRRTRDAAFQAYAHQDLPFERLVEELQPERSLNASPFFQVMLAFQNVRHASLPGMPELAIEPLPAATGTVKFDLSLTVNDAEGFAGTVEYAAELFDGTTIDRLLGHLSTFLDGGIANPEGRFSELPLLRPEERHQLLLEWGDTAGADPRQDLSLHRLVLAQAASTPEALAVISGGECLTYRELDARSGRLAARLAGAGIGMGAFVPVLLEGGADLVVALLGILRTGAAFVPLDPAWPAARLSSVLQDVGDLAQGIVVGDREVGTLGAFSWRLLRVDGDPEAAPASLPAVTPAEAPIYAIYTSGSTGRPKGVLVPHRGIVNRFLWMDRFFGAGTAKSVLQTTRHVYDSVVWQLFWPLTHGGATILTQADRSADPAYLCDLIESHGITLADLVPSVFNLLAQHLGSGTATTARLASLRALIVGGEEMTPAAASSFSSLFPEILLVNLYGPTEASIGCIYHRVGGGAGGRVPIGRPILNVHPVILDRWGGPAPVGVPGELCLSGLCLGLGYLGDGGKTGGAFVPNPLSEIPCDRLYRTGDLARRLPGGEIDFLGRIDRQVKIRGLRIELGEVETVLASRPGVRDAVVLARQETGGVRLVAYVTLEAGAHLMAADLRSSLREVLPDSMIPSAFGILEALPLAPSGKVDRRALAALERPGGVEPEVGSETPRTPTEEIVAGIWGEMLGVERVGAGDDFFALGGHSLLAMRVISRLRDAFGVELPLRELFEQPTVAGLGGRIEAVMRSGERALAPPLVPVERSVRLPLSFAQGRLWFLDQLQSGGPAYNIPIAQRLIGPLDVSMLGRALTEIVRRHEVLRTVYAVSEGEPVQVVRAPVPFRLPLLDLSALPEAAREAEALKLANQEALRPFDLLHDPMLRAVLARLGREEHTVLATMHHIASDGWSMSILLRELQVLYESFLQGLPSPLPPMPIQYADFAVWQREWLRGEVLEAELAYWRERLAGMPPLLELPWDRPRLAVQSSRGAGVRCQLPPELSRALQALARRQGATIFMVLLAGFQALLGRYSGQEDISVGTPTAGRTRSEIEGLIGFFVNTLVLRGDLSGEPSFRELLGRVRQASLEAHEHQEVPFERLVEELAPERSLSYTPLFQVMFVLQNVPRQALDLPGLRLVPMESGAGAAKFDLTLGLMEEKGRVSGALGYNTDLFDGATMERMLGHLERLLLEACASPERRLSDLVLLGEAERGQLLWEWNDTAVGAGEGLCLHELFERQAAVHPEAVALVHGEEEVRYGELNRRAERLASRLRRMGAGPERIVGVFLERKPELVVALLGVLKSGGAYLPLDPAHPAERLGLMLADSGAIAVVSRGELAARLPGSVPVCPVEEEGEEAAAGPDPGAEVGADNLAYLIYTSGSTGRPKAVAICHRSAARLLDWAGEVFVPRELSRVLAATSVGFDLSVFELFLPLSRGGTVVLAANALALPGLGAAGVTLVNTVPSVMAELVRTGGLPSTVRTVNLAGEALPRWLVEELYRTGHVERVYNLYGPSEDTTYSTFALMVSGGLSAPPIGRPIDGTRVYVLDGWMSLQPRGVSGELWIGGEGLARGYLGRPELTAERFVPDPFGSEPGSRLYRTGDLVRYRSDGDLEFLGRRDHQVKLRGFRIELGEIEAALEEQAGVIGAVVEVRTDGRGDRRLVAYVATGGESVEVGRLREGLQKRLPEYMVPSVFLVLDSLPLTPNGKVDRGALSKRPLDAEQRPGAGEIEAPRTPLERDLAALFARALGHDRFGIRDSFFSVGGNSIAGAILIAQLQERLGEIVHVVALFDHPTVAGLADYLTCEHAMAVARVWGRAGEPSPAPLPGCLVGLQRGGAKRPLFLVHPVFGDVHFYRYLARALDPERPVYGLQSVGLDGTGEPLSSLEDMAAVYCQSLRLVQPHGPYLLAGSSMGGVVAYEMATQLGEAGEDVAFLGLVDSWLLDTASPEIGHEEAELAILDYLTRAGGGDVQSSALRLSEIERLSEIFVLNSRALRAYRPRPRTGSLVYFRAASNLPAERPQDLWDQLCSGRAEVHLVPGDHLSALFPPQVRVLGERLREALEAAEANNGR